MLRQKQRNVTREGDGGLVGKVGTPGSNETVIHTPIRYLSNVIENLWILGFLQVVIVCCTLLKMSPRKEKRSSLGIYRSPWVGEGRGEDVNNNTDQGVSQVLALTAYCTLYTTRASECLQMIWRHIYMTSVTGVLMTQILLRHAGVPVSLIIKLTTRGGEKTSDVTYAESVLFLENQQNHLWYYWLKRRTVANESWVTVVDVMMQMTSLWSCHEVVTTDYFYSQLIRLWYSFCRCTTMDQFAYICLDGLHCCQFYLMFCVSFHRKYAARFHCFIWWGDSAFQSRY